MSDLLSIGSSGVSAYQHALVTVSNNIANVSTEGYARQDVSITANAPSPLGGSYIGAGSHFDTVRRQYDAFIESNLRSSNSDLKSQEPLLSYVNRLIDVMGDQNIGLTSAMNQFFESSRSLASDSASQVTRSNFLRDADGLAARFKQLASQFELLDNETQQSVEADVGQVNSITRQLAQINKQLTKESSASRQPSELLDQRDLLLRNLSGLIGIKTRFAENGSVLVSVGDTINQGILVRDNASRDLSVLPSKVDPNKLQFVIDAYGTPEGMPTMTSGKIGGTMTFRDQVLSPAVASIDGLAKSMVEQVNSIHREGIDAEGSIAGDLFGFAAGQEGKASGMLVLIQDATRVAAAGQFRIIDNPLNPGTALARIAYDTPQYAGPTALAYPLDSAQVPQIATLNQAIPANQGFSSLGLVRAGTQDLVMSLAHPSATQSLQVFTRDGKQLLGTDLSGTSIAQSIVQSANGMEAGASYNKDLLNAQPNTSNGVTTDPRYLDMDLFIGVKADVRQEMRFDSVTRLPIEPERLPAVMKGSAISGSDWQNAIAKVGAFTLDGVALKPPSQTSNSNPANLAEWVNSQGILGLTASMSGGALQISRSDTLKDIRLGMGPNGNGADLAALGFDTSVYVSGSAKDDLLVFVTDTAPLAANAAPNSTLSTASVTAQFQGVQGELKQILREQSLQVTFTSDTQYEIRDKLSDTVLATRQLDNAAAPTIAYRGLTLSFSTHPKSGDQFTIDGNKDGIGNNEAMLKMVDLENGKVMPSGQTMTEAYIERVNLVGSVAKQAAISKQAMTVVNQQAQQARDSVSGVSLDQEASELVRFQQAYQANAKTMQVASQLFDAILQVR